MAEPTKEVKSWHCEILNSQGCREREVSDSAGQQWQKKYEDHNHAMLSDRFAEVLRVKKIRGQIGQVNLNCQRTD